MAEDFGQARPYGIELLLDLHGCDPARFTTHDVARYFVDICELIGMRRHGDPMFWHEARDIPHLKGLSAVQFIETSNVVVHCIEMRREVYVNIFSCKRFNHAGAERFTAAYFGAQSASARMLERR